VFFHEFEGKGFNKEDFDLKVKIFKENIQSHSYRQAVLEPQWRWSRAGNVWEVQKQQGKFSCRLSQDNFDHNVVLPNGDVYICCQDYCLKHKIGNLYETHYNNLNRSSLIDFSNQEDSEIICRNCEHFNLKSDGK